MKYHELNSRFKLTLTAINEEWIVVVREDDTVYHDKHYNEDFRKTCEGCIFCKRVMRTCCGHRYEEHLCQATAPSRCTPQEREDGKFVKYKRVVRKTI